MSDTTQKKHGVIIWGTGGHARVVAELVQLHPEFHLAGFIDDNVRPEDHLRFLDSPIHGGRDQLDRLWELGNRLMMVAIGNCAVRLQTLHYAWDRGWESPLLIHPHSFVSASATLMPGTVVCAGAVVGVYAEVGHGCIINTAASVDHDSRLADGVHICPGAHLAGDVTVGEQSWIGIGSSVVEQTRIGSRVLLGAGSVVTKNLPDDVRAWGVPARVQS